MPYYKGPGSKNPMPTNRLTMVKDETRKIVINGLAQSKQHYKLVASIPDAIDIIAKPDNNKIEQSINLIAKQAHTIVILTPEDPKHPNVAAPDLPKLTINILNKLELPTEISYEQLLLFKVLISEVLSVENANYDEKLALQSMQWMRYALLNRIELSNKFDLPTITLGVPQKNRTLTATIFNGNVIGGFNKSRIAPAIEEKIHQIFSKANTGSYPYFKSNRNLINNAKNVATGILTGTDPKKVYGWRTVGATRPSKNFVSIGPLQGQEFYTLSDDFLNSLKKK